MEEILYAKFRTSKDRWVVHAEIEELKSLAKKQFVFFFFNYFKIFIVIVDCTVGCVFVVGAKKEES